MDPQLSQDSLSDLQPLPDVSTPTTPQPAHAAIADSAVASVAGIQASRLENATRHMTPPPSTQVPSAQRARTRTPTPTASHISTPPPTIDILTQTQTSKASRGPIGTFSDEDLSSKSAEELRTIVTELQAGLQEAKMSAAHHKLQYQMLSQESAAAIERMAVEARMAQYENEVIHSAEQARAAALPVQSSPLQENMIPVQKDLYQRMCRDIQNLSEDRNFLVSDNQQKERVTEKQELQIERLNDKISLLREVVRESREQLGLYRRAANVESSTPRSVYSTPLRHGVSRHEQPQPFAALLQASEMASQEARRPTNPSTSSKKSHGRNTHSLSSLPATPSRVNTANLHAANRSQQQHHHQNPYSTPQGRHARVVDVPATAPIPRTSSLRSPSIYSHTQLPVSARTNDPRTTATTNTAPPQSDDGTVSVSDHDNNAPDDDNDSEAETDIIDPIEDDENPATTSQASIYASQMLRSSREEQMAKRESFEGRGMLQGTGSGREGAGGRGQSGSRGGRGGAAADRYRQTTLSGNVRKPNVVRAAEDDIGPPAKRAKVDYGQEQAQSSLQQRQSQQSQAVGLGIAGVRH